MVALAARREARGRLRPRGGARPRARASATRHVDPRDRLALGGVGGAAHRGRPRRGDGRRARAALLQGLPLGLAQHGGARDARPTTSRSTGGVVERDASGEPTGILREESAWQFRARYAMPPEDEFVDATREGLRIAASRGVVAIHDKDGWLGAPRIFQRIAERDGLTLRVWQSVPYERLPELEALTVRSRHRRRLPPHRLPESVHGRDARVADRLDARRIGRRHHERRGARGGDPRGRAPGLARRRARDRRSGEPRGARRVRVDPRPLGAPRPAASRRARPVPRARGRRPVRGSRSRLLRPVQSRAIGSRPRGAVLAGAGRRCVRVPLAVGVGRARRERLRRAGRGARPARRRSRRRPADDRRSAGLAPGAVPHGRAGAPRVDRHSRLALTATSAAAASSFPATSPTSSCSRATRSSARRTSWRRSSVVATMVGGRWVHNPPPWE